MRGALTESINRSSWKSTVQSVRVCFSGCGASCTEDGIHYSNSTHDAALQIWANSLEMSLRQPSGTG